MEKGGQEESGSESGEDSGEDEKEENRGKEDNCGETE